MGEAVIRELLKLDRERETPAIVDDELGATLIK